MTQFAHSDIELAKSHFEEKLKVTLGPVEMQHLMEDPQEKNNFTLIDVRSREGYQEEHVPGAINIPEEELENRLSEIPKDKAVIVYCWTITCHLAAHAGLTLAKHGYFVRELEGGIQEWKENDMPVERTPESLSAHR